MQITSSFLIGLLALSDVASCQPRRYAGSLASRANAMVNVRHVEQHHVQQEKREMSWTAALMNPGMVMAGGNPIDLMKRQINLGSNGISIGGAGGLQLGGNRASPSGAPGAAAAAPSGAPNSVAAGQAALEGAKKGNGGGGLSIGGLTLGGPGGGISVNNGGNGQAQAAAREGQRPAASGTPEPGTRGSALAPVPAAPPPPPPIPQLGESTRGSGSTRGSASSPQRSGAPAAGEAGQAAGGQTAAPAGEAGQAAGGQTAAPAGEAGQAAGGQTTAPAAPAGEAGQAAGGQTAAPATPEGGQAAAPAAGGQAAAPAAGEGGRAGAAITNPEEIAAVKEGERFSENTGIILDKSGNAVNVGGDLGITKGSDGSKSVGGKDGINILARLRKIVARIISTPNAPAALAATSLPAVPAMKSTSLPAIPALKSASLPGIPAMPAQIPATAALNVPAPPPVLPASKAGSQTRGAGIPDFIPGTQPTR